VKRLSVIERLLLASLCFFAVSCSAGKRPASSSSAPPSEPLQVSAAPPPSGPAVPADAAAPSPSAPASAAPAPSAPAAVPELPTASVSVAALLAAAGKADFAVLSLQAADAERAGLAEALIADLEARAAAPDAPPEVHVALSALYGRKGLKTKEYAALAAAETAAAKPGISFNVGLVHGRKSLLAGAPDADSFMVGGLELASDPPGAAVWIDGAPSGTCPVRVEQVRAGTRKLRFAMQGYAEAETTAEVGVGRSVAVAAALKPNPARVAVTADGPDAKLFIGEEERPLGTSFELPAGTYDLSVRDPNRVRIDERIDLKPGEEIRRSYAMELAVHRWNFLSVPSGATLSIDGKTVGKTPLHDHPVQTGIHALKYELDGYATLSKNEKLELTGFMMPYSNEHLSYKIPSAAIKLDGKREDWANVRFVPMEGSRERDMIPDAAGSYLKRVYIAQDDKNVYWLMEFADGKPSRSTGVCYSVQFHTDPAKPDRHIALKLASWDNSGGYKPELPYGPDAAGSWTDQWKNGGSSFDYRVGPDFIEARFPKLFIFQTLKDVQPYRVIACTYLEGKNGSDSRWYGLENRAVQFK
jgi:hypothetical protein